MDDRAMWNERLKQAQRDLEELEQQIAEGEISGPSGEALRQTYRREIEDAAARLADHTETGDPGSDSGHSDSSAPGFWNRGRVVVLTILGAAGVALLISVGWFAQTESPTPEEQFDPSQYSNETMEAVIAANSDHPDINGMRLALAGRYFSAGEFQEAFGHYRETLDNNPAPHEEAEALGRLGWMAWAGSGETQLALQTLDRALQAAPDDPQNLYFKAIVLWCGAGRAPDAVPLLEQVAQALPSQDEVASELAAARAEEECR